MSSATDRNTINKDNYIFYFSKLLTSRGIKIQNDVLTKEKIATNWAKYIEGISVGLSALFWIYNCIKPDTTVRTAEKVTAHASHMINRTGTLFNYAWGEDGLPPSYQEYGEASAKPFGVPRTESVHGWTKSHEQDSNACQQEEYIDQGSCLRNQGWSPFVDEDREALNEKGRDDLKDLYTNNQNFRDEVINFVGDKTGLGNQKILDKRYKNNTLNKLRMEIFGIFTFSKNHSRNLIEIIASYK